MTQTYDHPVARERMSQSLCPECGETVSEHGGRGSAMCSLTDTGVAQRIYAYEKQIDPDFDLGRSWLKRYEVAQPVRMHIVDKVLGTENEWQMRCSGGRATREFTGRLHRQDKPCPKCLKATS